MKDDILDQFNDGKISIEETKRMLSEFAKYELQLTKTAMGLKFVWVKKQS